jgi:hypothetical protein
MKVVGLIAAGLFSVLGMASTGLSAESIACQYFYLNQDQSISDQGAFNVDPATGGGVAYTENDRNIVFYVVRTEQGELLLLIKDMAKEKPYDALTPLVQNSGFLAASDVIGEVSDANTFYSAVACAPAASMLPTIDSVKAQLLVSVK